MKQLSGSNSFRLVFSVFFFLSVVLYAIPLSASQERFQVPVSLSGEENRPSGPGNLSPVLRFAFGVSWWVDPDKKEELKELSREIGRSGAKDAATVLETVEARFDEAVGMLTERWITQVKENIRKQLGRTKADEEWNKFISDDNLWGMLLSVYLDKYKDAGVELSPAVKERVTSKFTGFRVKEKGTSSPGTRHIRSASYDPLTDKEHQALNRAIASTINADTEEYRTYENIPDPGTGGTFVVLEDDLFNVFVKQLGVPPDIMCHPGTNGTVKNYKKGEPDPFKKVEKYYYIRKSLFDRLSTEDKKTFARHEEMHIRIAAGDIDISQELARGVTEETWVNNQPDCDVRPIVKRFSKAVPAVEGAQKAMRSPPARIRQIRRLLRRMDAELKQAGSKELPLIMVMSDYHGAIKPMLGYIANAIYQKTGKKVTLDDEAFPKISIKEQLRRQDVNIDDIGMTFYLLGDFLDRGSYGVKCFRAAEELVGELVDHGVARYVTGNHDLWALLNLNGFHLPVYKGYNFYGHAASEELVKEHWNDSRIKADRIGWWTKKLAEYNKAQKQLQDTIFDGDAKSIREKLKETYLQIKDQLTDEEQKLWEDLVGFYFGTTDVFTGFRSVGMMSVKWWEERLKMVREFARAEDAERPHAQIVWKELEKYTEEAARVVKERLDRAMEDGKWWWRVFNDINHQNYTSVEWWGKDWSSHKGWGTSVIDELNELEEGDVEWTQENYIKNPHLRDLQLFYRQHFTLYLKDPYGNIYTHGWLPIDVKTGEVSFTYRNVTYKGQDIWRGLELIQNDIRNLSTPLSELYEAFSLVNSWYADKTTSIKPDHIKTYISDVGLKNIYDKLGIKTWFTCHNPLNKLHLKGIGFMEKQGEYLHFSVDKGMSWEKFKDLGGYVLVGANGVLLRGFIRLDSDDVVDSPPTIKLDKDKKTGRYKVGRVIGGNESLERGTFLELMKKQLEEELARLEKAESLTFSVRVADPAEIGPKVPGTGVYGVEVKGVFENLGTGALSTMYDSIKIHADEEVEAAQVFAIVDDRVHHIDVEGGKLMIVLPGGEVLSDDEGFPVVFARGAELTVNKEGVTTPDGKKYPFMQAENAIEYKIRKISREPVDLKVYYKKTGGEKAVYAAYEMLMRHSATVAEKKIDLILPKRMFPKGSAGRVQRTLDGSFGKGMITIKTYDDPLGLTHNDVKAAIANSERSERTPVLGATKLNITSLSRQKDGEFWKLIERTRILALPNLETLEDQGWAFTLEAAIVGALQACLTADAIKEEKPIARDMRNLMSQLTGRRVALKDLYYMLTFSDENIPEEIKPGNPFEWMLQLVKKLLLKMPMTPFDAKEQLMLRRKFMYSA